jgi:hypothetical protein
MVVRAVHNVNILNPLYYTIKKMFKAGYQWLTPIILATWKAEIGRIKVRGQPGRIVHETPISKITRAKWTGGVAQALESLLCSTKP